MVYILVDPTTKQVTNTFYDVQNAPDSVKNNWIEAIVPIPTPPTVATGQSAVLCYDEKVPQFFYNVVTTQALTDALAAKITELEQAYSNALAAGFTSSANGTATVYGFAPSDQINMSMVTESIDQNIQTFPIQYADVNGNIAVINDATQWHQLCTDANSFQWGLVGKLRGYLSTAKAATTVDAVNAISW